MGGIDLLVMVAGQMPTVDGIEDFDTAVWRRLVDTNLSSLFWLTKAALPHLGAGASIIATASQQGFTPSPSLVEYAVTTRLVGVEDLPLLEGAASRLDPAASPRDGGADD